MTHVFSWRGERRGEDGRLRKSVLSEGRGSVAVVVETRGQGGEPPDASAVSRGREERGRRRCLFKFRESVNYTLNGLYLGDVLLICLFFGEGKGCKLG